MQEVLSQQLAPVAELDVRSRTRFIARTYLHLLGALVTFTLTEIVLFRSGAAYSILEFVSGTSWLLVLGGFMIVGWLASRTAARARSVPAQYAALAAYVIAEAVLFVPMLFIAEYRAPGVIQSAALVTLVGSGALTAIVLLSRKDFTFLDAIIKWGFVVAVLAIVASLVVGYQLGTFFSVIMIALAGGAILNSTSKILLYYPQDRYVAAALELFASIALMFWYVLRLLSRR